MQRGAGDADQRPAATREKLSQRPAATTQRPGTKPERSIILPVEESSAAGTKPEPGHSKNATAAAKKCSGGDGAAALQNRQGGSAAKTDHNRNGSLRHGRSIAQRRSYVLALKGAATGNGSLADPHLRRHDAGGALIAENDDSGGQEKLTQRPVAKMQRRPQRHARGVMTLLHNTHLKNGDPLVRLAWDHSQAANATAFASDLQAAKDYREYLDDKPTIDALMAVEPGSAFTAGWALTLLKARELGLDAVPANDDFRNGNDVAYGTAGADHMVGGAGNDNFSGLGGNDRLSGGPGDDVLFGYAGNDAIDGGAGFDRALFAGSRVLYTISKLGNGLVRVSGQDGTDTLSNVEQLIFVDATVTDDYADRLGDPMLPVWMTQRHDPRAPKPLWN
jgi:Ca2+-binding RTX toxin-like protein